MFIAAATGPGLWHLFRDVDGSAIAADMDMARRTP
jgi:hypothetical protein